MTRADAAWAAGLFEGEGNVRLRNPNRATGYNAEIIMQINMTDREPLERMHALYGGYFYGPYHDKRPNRKPRYEWSLYGTDRVAALRSEWAEWLSPRRLAQFDAALAG